MATPRTIQWSEGASGGTHSWAIEEADFFVQAVNAGLSGDPSLASRLPLSGPESLFDACADGVLLCKLVNLASPGAIDERAVNFPSSTRPSLNPWEASENINLALGALRNLGAVLVNIHPGDISSARELKREYLVLAVVWQAVRLHLLGAVTIRAHPELAILLREGESLQVSGTQSRRRVEEKRREEKGRPDGGRPASDG